MNRSHLILLVALAAAAAGTQAAPAAAQAGASASARRLPLAHGEVLEVDPAGQRVTVKHGRIASLGMDPMTMEFLLPDAKLLASLKPGDRIRFAAAYQGGEYVITRVQRQKRHATPRSKSP